ncbi:replication-relaxation family protein [Delftia lacustris]|uniref:replication-relaxation family protein n=1 Tax=Delftia lacustris TaxID=558537 RepID=UPI0013142F8A|nr:replication-relaxation family protein [Delftia lacustris]
MKQDNRITGEKNQLSTLINLHRFGWLTSRMLASLVWPNANTSLTLARRSLKELLNKKMIIKRALPAGGDCYTLSTSGARFLQVNSSINAKSGAKLKLGNPVHRACCNWFLIENINAGLTVWTEHEIQQRLAPIHSLNGKVPDALISTEHGLVWVEVENTWKNKEERQKIVRLCKTLLPREHSTPLTEISEGLYLFRIIIVSNTSSALKAIVRTFIESYEANELSEVQAADVDLHYLALNQSLIRLHVAQGNLWHDAINKNGF